MKTVLIILVITLFQSCRDKYPGEPLGIRNNTDKRVYYWFAYWKMKDYTKYHYPDTILPIEKPVFLNSMGAYNGSGDGEADPDWKKIFSELPAGRFSVYFFTEPINTQEEWNIVREKYNLKRKDVTYQELVANNYVIQYP